MIQNVFDSYSQVFSNKQKILLVFAHPDDLELYAGGTVARLTADGKVVRSIKVTSGDMGSRGQKITPEELKQIRVVEDAAAMDKLGILPENNIYLGVPDGTIDNSLSLINQISFQIRLFQPDIIITHNPEHKIIRFSQDSSWVNHRDHLNTGLSTIDAAYPYSRDLLFFPEHFQNPLTKPASCSEFLLVDYYDNSDNVFIDVTNTVTTRVEAHSLHSSQYSKEQAQDSADFFTSSWDPSGQKNYEIFRHVIAD